VTNFEPGTALLFAYGAKRDITDAAKLYDQIVPKSERESELLYFRATEFFTVTRNKQKAEIFLSKLQKVSHDPDITDPSEAFFQCTFDRCAFALDKLKRLTSRHPETVGYNSLLGYSYADMHDFHNAAQQFDVVMNRDFSAFDSTTALVAVVSYANTGQRGKASAVVDRFGQAGVPPAAEANFLNMKRIAEDTSGQTFLFSQWPPQPKP
jgi:hypothetical protein